jgi:hypothetical protein
MGSIKLFLGNVLARFDFVMDIFYVGPAVLHIATGCVKDRRTNSKYDKYRQQKYAALIFQWFKKRHSDHPS